MPSSKSLESKPSLANLSQIQVPSLSSGTSKKLIEEVAKNLEAWGLNFSLPIVCLTDTEDKYQLLTGLPIYEAATTAGMTEIWVFLIAAKQMEAKKLIKQALRQSELNEEVIDSDAIEEFVSFINTSKASDLVTISGIKDKSAQLIIDKRPYSSSEDLKKLGSKRSLKWLRAYKKRGLGLQT